MSAALCALLEVVSVDPKPYKNLIPSFISILKQVAPSVRLVASSSAHAPRKGLRLCLLM
jgi:hypothetical protein